MKLIRNIGDGAITAGIFTLIAITCLLFGDWNPGGEIE